MLEKLKTIFCTNYKQFLPEITLEVKYLRMSTQKVYLKRKTHYCKTKRILTSLKI